MCGARPGVFPVLYALLDEDVVFRTAPGEKLIAAALQREVVFEIDSYDLAARTGWSVNLLGTMTEIDAPDQLRRAQSLGLDPWAGEIRDRYVRIAAHDITGRRIAPNSTGSTVASVSIVTWAGPRAKDCGQTGP